MKLATIAIAAVAATASATQSEPVSYDQYIMDIAAVNAADQDSLTPLIVGGTEIPKNSRRYITGLKSSTSGSSFCGGQLIAPKWVLTAAHCDSSNLYVNVGTHYLSGSTDGNVRKVIRRIKHPKYTDASTSGFDFLLLELQTPVTSIEPVALARADGSDEVPGLTSTTLGWGTTTEGGAQSKVRLAVDVPIVSNADCQKKLTVNPSMICAGGEANKDSCQGDSGGPLITNRNGTDALVGVVSWGQGCGRLGYPGVYARVSAGLDFIRKYVPEARWL